MITERTLRNWRQQALKPFYKQIYDTTEAEHIAVMYEDARQKILRLTMELMDIQLLQKLRKG